MGTKFRKLAMKVQKNGGKKGSPVIRERSAREKVGISLIMRKRRVK